MEPPRAESTRRTFLKNAVLGSASVALAPRLAAANAPAVPTPLARPPRRPNVLLLWSNQVRTDTMPYMNNPIVHMPTFEALAARSFVFPGARCTQPVCTPSRGSLMTGRWPHSHGSVRNNIPLRANARCVAEMLPAEYATSYMGKWHLGSEITAQHGFREWVSIEDADPGERHNRVRDGAQAERVHRMTDQLRAWQAAHHDQIPLAV